MSTANGTMFPIGFSNFAAFAHPRTRHRALLERRGAGKDGMGPDARRCSAQSLRFRTRSAGALPWEKT